MFPSVLTCQVVGKTHTCAKYPGWFSAHCCVFALSAVRVYPAPVPSVMAAEQGYCREQRESQCLVKAGSPWKQECPCFVLLDAFTLPICPMPREGA